MYAASKIPLKLIMIRHTQYTTHSTHIRAASKINTVHTYRTAELYAVSKIKKTGWVGSALECDDYVYAASKINYVQPLKLILLCTRLKLIMYTHIRMYAASILYTHYALKLIRRNSVRTELGSAHAE